MAIIGGGGPYTTGPTVPLPEKTTLLTYDNEKIMKEMHSKERKEQIAAIKRRFDNHEEILEFIDKLPEERKDYVLSFLYSLRKKQRDEFNWEKFKDKLIAGEEPNLR